MVWAWESRRRESDAGTMEGDSKGSSGLKYCYSVLPYVLPFIHSFLHSSSQAFTKHYRVANFSSSLLLLCKNKKCDTFYLPPFNGRTRKFGRNKNKYIVAV